MKISVKKSTLVPCPLNEVNPGEIFWCDHIHNIDGNPLLFMNKCSREKMLSSNCRKVKK